MKRWRCIHIDVHKGKRLKENDNNNMKRWRCIHIDVQKGKRLKENGNKHMKRWRCSYIDVRKGKSLKGNDNKKTKRWRCIDTLYNICFKFSPFMFELVVYFKVTSADKGHTTPRPWNKAAYFVVSFFMFIYEFRLLILLDVWYNLHLLAAL
jgi:hypothetical protein